MKTIKNYVKMKKDLKQLTNIFPHVGEATNAILENLRKSRKTCLIMPTGTGKTMVSSIVVGDLGMKTMYLCPNAYILEQTKERYTESSLNSQFMTYPEMMSRIKSGDLNYFSGIDLFILDEFHRLGSEIWGESWREKTFERDKQENLYDFFVSFPDFSSLLEAWETPEGKAAISEFIPSELRCLFKPYKLTFEEGRILRVFGHSKEELKDFEEKINTERKLKLQESEEKFKDYLGWSVAVFYNHFSMWGGSEAGKKLKNWLETNYDPEDWTYSY